MTRVLIFALTISAIGCSDDCPPPLDDCIETALVLQQGVYGRVVSQQDVRINDCPAYPQQWPNNRLVLYELARDVLVAEDISDGEGLYELPAEPGDYRVCLGDYCVPVTIEINERVRADLALPFAKFDVRGPGTCG